jgi:hypothetical protein
MNIDDGIPLGLRHVDEHAVPEDSGVVDEDVEPAEVLDGLVDQRARPCEVGDIVVVDAGVPAGGGYLVGNCPCGGPIRALSR